ncbi:MAG: DUF3047 domain-containing protein [Gammaproteobacteria bacterium]|nr:DUF3047 domain-containing protein [Gammaproteobacteria bacterium]
MKSRKTVHLRFFLCGLLLMLIAAPIVYANSAKDVEAGLISSELKDGGWKLLKKYGTDPTRFELLEDGSIRVIADDSNALIYRKISGDQAQKRFLQWQWRVDERTRATNIVTKHDDDRPIALYVAFNVDKKYQNWWVRWKNKLLYTVAGIPVSGKVLTYVWGGIGEIGDSYPNPYVKRIGVMNILQTSDSQMNAWITEKIDLMADFEKAFGHPAKSAHILAVSADSEDTKERSVALLRDIVFID